MKNIKKLLIFLFCFSAILIFSVSCTSNQPNSANPVATEPTSSTVPSEIPEPDSQESDINTTREILSSASVNNDFTEISRYSYDMDGDGENEDIVLTINAEKNSKGEFIMNDGQNWQLYIKDNENYYILIDKYVQLGEIRFDIMDYYVAGTPIPTVVATTDTGAMLKLTAYTFNSENNCYIERVLYNSSNESESGINKMYSSNSEVR